MTKSSHETAQEIALKPSQVILSSSVGGLIVSLLMTPVDVVKVRLQVQTKPIVPGHCFLYCNGLMDHLCPCLNGNSAKVTVGSSEFTSRPNVLNSPHNSTVWYRRPGHFTSSFDAVYQISRHEGVFSLWSGLSPTLVMALPQTVIYYTLNDYILSAVGYKAGHDNRSWVPAVVGGASRVVALAVISPLELIRIKKQSTKLSLAEVKQSLLISIKQGGYKSLWIGMGPSMLRDVPFSMIFWFLYQGLKSRYIKKHPVGVTPELDISHALIYGAISGTVAGIITLPFDVVKTHRQIELGEATFFNRPLQSTLHSLKELYQQKGFRSLFAGFTPRVVKVAPACALMIGTFELLKGYFRAHNQRLLQSEK